MTAASPRYYSYLRFSTPEQATGDSIRRQKALAEEWAEKHGVVLDDSLRMQDHGLSGFHQKNVEKNAALGQFLQAIQQGQIPRGSVLLVESLDRLSRATVKDALRQFMNILEAGVDIETLGDKQRYSWDGLDEKQLIISIFIASRAHEESAEKSRRIGSNWREKHRKAREAKKPATSKIPLWLNLDKKSGTIQIIEERADVVRQIFQWALAGDGVGVIAGRLNQDKVPVWGKSPVWNASYINLILKGGAAAGHYTPTTLIEGKRTAQETIKDYYPAIVSEDVFHQTIQAMKSRNLGAGRPGKMSNLFPHLCRCGYCNRPVTHIYRSGKEKRDSGRERLVCSEARKKVSDCDQCSSIDYLDFEETFLRYCAEVDLSVLLEQDSRAGEIVQAQADIDIVAGKIGAIEAKIEGIMEVIEEASNPATAKMLAKKLDSNMEQKEILQRKHEAATIRLEALKLQGQSVADHISSIKELTQIMNNGDEEDRIRIRRKVKHEIARAVDRITVFTAGLQGRYVESGKKSLEIITREPGFTQEQEQQLWDLLPADVDFDEAKEEILQAEKEAFLHHKVKTTGRDKACFLVRFRNGHSRFFQWNKDNKVFDQVQVMTKDTFSMPGLNIQFSDGKLTFS